MIPVTLISVKKYLKKFYISPNIPANVFLKFFIVSSVSSDPAVDPWRPSVGLLVALTELIVLHCDTV